MITCAFCPAHVLDVDAAIAADWIPSYEAPTKDGVHYVEYADPVCPRCQASKLVYLDGDGPFYLREGKVPA